MCGIAGFLDRSCPAPEAPERLRRMLALIAHRGPDGEGTHCAPELGLALGMRRLSIIDLAGGRQPIWNENGQVGVVFNGEIYNYVELRRELRERGHVFRTDCDTEVLVHLYEEAGPKMVSRLRGMFAFAIVDLTARQLFIARDHFGQKPLYYCALGDRLAFASELKCLLALPWVPAELDPAAFLDYAAWLSLPAPQSHFQHVRKLPAGHHLRVPLDDPGAFVVEEYWRYRLDEPPTHLALEPAAEELEAVLTDSVRAHLRSDVPLGVLLSSGLDSRTVAAFAQESLEGTMQTFTVGFAGPESELVEAARTAAEIGSKHHALEITAGDLSAKIGRVAWHLDEPVGDPAAFAVLAVCEMARAHVKVLLSGEGADELFAGYQGRYQGMSETLRRSDRFRWLGRFLPEPDGSASPSRWQRFATRARHSRGSETVALRLEGLPGDVRHPRALTVAQRHALRARMTTLGGSAFRSQRDLLSSLLTFDLEWQLAESLLQKADKMSMAASIELRTPLLDVRVAELAAQIDSSLKLPPGGPGKMVLRHCLSRKLHEPLTRPKKGFPIPLADWFTGPLRAEVEESLFGSGSAVLQHLDRALLRSAWDEFQRGEWEGARSFYALWLYNVWAAQVACARLQTRAT